MEVSALKHRPALRGPTPFLRLQGDERLVALTRRGNESAYEVLVARYQVRLQAFCRHMLSSREDAEDVLQEVFAAAYNAMLSDDRPINVRPWLYRIARNRSLNHLRKATAVGVDSMDVHLADHGTSTADRVHKREEFRELVVDVQGLPETQRTALLLREIDALSYEQIAQAMETTVPAIKSLLVRARVGLAEAAEARALSCEEVRAELGEVAEGLTRKSPPVRRHVRGCDRCAAFDKRLSQTNSALAAVFPVGPLLLLKKFLLAQGASSAAGAASAAGGSAAAGAAASAGAGAGVGGALSAGVATLATKTAAVVAGAAIVTAGAVEVDHSRSVRAPRAAVTAAAPVRVAPPAPRVVATTPQPVRPSGVELAPTKAVRARKAAVRAATAAATAATAAAVTAATPAVAAAPAAPTAATGPTGATGAPATPPPSTGTIDEGSDTTTLPPPERHSGPPTTTVGPPVTAPHPSWQPQQQPEPAPAAQPEQAQPAPDAAQPTP
jgi:RNA polymerase sigma factor (sigma-70 family)